MTDDFDFAGFDQLSQVVAQPLKFKAQLGIGEAAYKSLLAGRTVADLFQVGTAAAAGGAAAGSGAVASTFFGTWLTAIGVGTAVTPIGWVIGGAAAAGALSWGVLRAWRGYHGSRVETVPRFINSPIDLLGAALFDLIAGLSLVVVREAGGIDDNERDAVRDYFVEVWGFDGDYIAAALPLLEESTKGKAVEEAAQALAQYSRENPDCNFKVIGTEVLRLLSEIAEADGEISAEEEAAIALAREVFSREEQSFLSRKAGEVAGVLAGVQKTAWAQAKGWLKRTPESDPEPEEQAEAKPISVPIPTIWLLGKTGAGKSSLVQAMTRAGAAEVGNGFEPCTKTATAFDYPSDEPVMRFLDTRGLGEIAYDPTADLAELQGHSHVALVLMRLDDPVQGVLTEALRSLRRQSPKLPMILVHTAADQPEDGAELNRVRHVNQGAAEKAWGSELPSVVLDLSNPESADLSSFEGALASVLPSVVMFLQAEAISGAEEAEFARNRSLVLRYAGGAGAGGALPVVGALALPSLQIAMLRNLAERYDVSWDKRRLAELAAALGTGILGAQALGFAARELGKLVPGLGQTIMPVVGAGWGFASTFALGRAACWWFHQQRAGVPVEEAELRQRFTEALRRAAQDAR